MAQLSMCTVTCRPGHFVTSQEGGRESVVLGSEDRSNPLWNGGSCVAMNTCSSFNSPSPPWFYRDLSHTTTEDIEMRLCVDEGRSNEDIAIETIEIYVQ